MAKVSPPVTLKLLKELKAAGKAAEIADGACPGLRIRAGAKGAMTWSLLARDADGKRRRIEVGEWPAIGIPEAREVAARLKADAKRASTPAAQVTLDDVLTLYGRSPAGERAGWPEAERAIRVCFRELLDARTAGLDGPRLQRAVDAYRSRTAASAAVRYIRPVFKWAERRGMTPRGVWSDLQQPVNVKKRNRILTDHELMRLYRTLGQHGHDGAVRMMLITACRREEVCAMRFEDIIEDIWYVPAELRKNGEELAVPLTWYAQTLVGAQGRTSGLVFLGPRGKPLDNWDRWQKKFNEKSGTEGWHRHDLRRTAATLLGDAGVAPHIIEIVLGHKHPHTQLAGVYNKSRYEKEHAEALVKLSDILCGLEIRARHAP